MDPNQSEQLVEQTLRGLKGYVVVGKSYIRVWHAWLLIGLVAGIATGVVLVANRNGRVEESLAAPSEQRKLITISVKVPSTFSLFQSWSAKVLNFKNANIFLKQIIMAASSGPPPPPSPIVQIRVSMPGGCGPKADPGCIGPPAFEKDYFLAQGETIDALGLQITFQNLTKNNVLGIKRATFRITTTVTVPTTDVRGEFLKRLALERPALNLQGWALQWLAQITKEAKLKGKMEQHVVPAPTAAVSQTYINNFSRGVVSQPSAAPQPQYSLAAANAATAASENTKRALASNDLNGATVATAQAVHAAVIAEAYDPQSSSAASAFNASKSARDSLGGVDPNAVKSADLIASALLVEEINQAIQAGTFQDVGGPSAAPRGSSAAQVSGAATGASAAVGQNSTLAVETIANVLAGNYQAFDPANFTNLGVFAIGPQFSGPFGSSFGVTVDFSTLSINTGIPGLSIGIGSILGLPVNPLSAIGTLKSMVGAINTVNNIFGFPYGSLFGSPTAYTMATQVHLALALTADPTLYSMFNTTVPQQAAEINAAFATLDAVTALSLAVGQGMSMAASQGGVGTFSLTAAEANTANQMGLSSTFNLHASGQGYAGQIGVFGAATGVAPPGSTNFGSTQGTGGAAVPGFPSFGGGVGDGTGGGGVGGSSSGGGGADGGAGGQAP